MLANELATYIVAAAIMNAPIQPTESLNELLCMTEAIYFEARGEDRVGRASVGLVIMNRVQSSSYPDTVCEVVSQPYQFSYRNGNVPRVVVNSIDSGDAEALRNIVQLSIDITNKHIVDFTDNSKWYFAHNTVYPNWAGYGEVSLVVNNHTFINNLRNR